MTNVEALHELRETLPPHVTLVAVSKRSTAEAIRQLYDEGQRIFGESYALELRDKHEVLPKDIAWHFIGHLQTNKVKYLIGYIAMIQSIDSMNLLKEIDRQAEKAGRETVDCLLQVHIAQEEQKFGFTCQECYDTMTALLEHPLPHITVRGLMGMASQTNDTQQIAREFESLHDLYRRIKDGTPATERFDTLSMGMSNDFPIALKAGATMVRIGSSLFQEKK